MKQFTYYISHTLAFKPYVGVDNSVYLKLERDEYGNEYYSYIILYVDYVLCIHKDPKKYPNLVDIFFRFKDLTV